MTFARAVPGRSTRNVAADSGRSEAMTERRFACTACGQCCYGVLPLTLHEAIESAGIFPLAMSITVIKAGSRGYSSVGNIGVQIPTKQRKPLSLLVFPVSFIPPSLPCPQLTETNLCSVHENKPLRCRTMPFYPYKDDDHQSEMLVPRQGWLCKTDSDAPVVYRNRQILDRGDFNNERAELVRQAPALQRYINLLTQYDRKTYERIVGTGKASVPGRVLVGFISYVRFNKGLDMLDFAQKQHPILRQWAERTSVDTRFAEYHNFYKNELSVLTRYLD